MPYFVYLMRCQDGTIYTGITTNLARRLAEHARGIGSRYTRARGSGNLIHSEKHANRSAASRREAEIKKWPRSKKLALAGGKPKRKRGSVKISL